MLVVIADNRINLSFAGVAMRVALGKLKALIDNNLGASSAALRGIDVAPPPPSALSGSIAQTSGPSTAGGFSTVSHQPPASRLPHSEIANSGLTWSGVSGSSSVSGSAVYVTDPASAEFLTICTKVLARSVGPMAKLYVRDAVRKLCAGKPFSRDISEELMTELVQQIKKPADAAQFRNLVLKSL